MRRFLHLVFFLCLLPLSAVAADPTVLFTDDDPEMNAAISDAQSTLPKFVAQVFGDGDTAHPAASVKVAIPTDDQGGNEHIWVGQLKKDGQGYAGQLANEPVNLPGMTLGSPVTFGSDRISDWAFVHTQSGKLFGHYTTRVVIQRIDAAQRKRIDAVLAKPPLPANW